MITPVPLRERKKARTRDAIAAAALELFGARGFQAVTLAEVAAAAEVGERTLFRYYGDKEELLFGGDEAVQAALRAALDGRPQQEPPAPAVLAAVLSLVPRWQDQRDLGRLRRAVIDSSPALQQRERAKHRASEDVLVDGLTARGLDRPAARILARTAVGCFDEGLIRWFGDDDPAEPGLARRVQATFAQLAGLLTPVARTAPGGAAARS